MEARVLYRGELGLDPALVAYGGKYMTKRCTTRDSTRVFVVLVSKNLFFLIPLTKAALTSLFTRFSHKSHEYAVPNSVIPS